MHPSPGSAHPPRLTNVMTLAAAATMTACLPLTSLNAEAGDTTPPPAAGGVVSDTTGLEATRRARAVAQAFGLEAWEAVQSVAFTFAVDLPDRSMTRAWVWFPHRQTATLRTAAGVTELDLTRPDGGDAAAHRHFINDTYWLVFPFQLLWSGPALTLIPGTDCPLPGVDHTDRLVVDYAAGGYTPGDRYVLFLEPGGTRVHGWSFVRGGAGQPATADAGDGGMVSVWSDPVDHEGLMITQRFEDPSGPFTLEFRDVSVEMVDR